MAYIWETDAWPNMTYDARALQRVFEQVTGKAGELAGLRESLSETDRFDTFVREVSAEGVNSFAIEGEVLDPEEMTQSLIASLRDRDGKAAAGNYRGVAEVMLDARETAQPLTVARLNDWHAQLFRNERFMKDVGRLRREDMQVVTVMQGEVREIHFEAPPPERLQREMERLVDWIGRTGPDGPDTEAYATPARAAIGHLWFETIHPYSDGNGRIGRAVADYIASQEPIFRQAPFSLSRAIQEDKDRYYGALQAAQSTMARDGALDVTPFISWFAGAMQRGIELAAQEARYIHNRNRFFERHEGLLNERQEKALRRVFREGPERLAQGLSSKPYQRITGASSATATRDLNDLADKGVLRRTEQGGRSTAYDIVLDAERTVGLARRFSQRAQQAGLATEPGISPDAVIDPAGFNRGLTRVEAAVVEHARSVYLQKADNHERVFDVVRPQDRVDGTLLGKNSRHYMVGTSAKVLVGNADDLPASAVIGKPVNFEGRTPVQAPDPGKAQTIDRQGDATSSRAPVKTLGIERD